MPNLLQYRIFRRTITDRRPMTEQAIIQRDLWIKENTPIFGTEPKHSGPHFLRGNSHPFPLNPRYQIVPPLSTETKNQIYERHKSGLSHLKIAQGFGVSVIRVNASKTTLFHLQVIKLCSIEESWKSKNIPIQTQLDQSMNRLLGSQTRHFSELEERKRPTPMEKIQPLLSERLKPLFQFIEHDAEGLNAIEASVLLKKIPFVMKPETYIKDPNHKPEFVEETELIQSKDSDKSRVSFLFTDPTKKDYFCVRESNGVLRKGFKSEKWWRDHRKPKYHHNKI